MRSRKMLGKTLSSAPINFDRPVQLHVVVTRKSGDTETYKLGEVPDMMAAIEYKRKLIAVKAPKRRRKVA